MEPLVIANSHLNSFPAKDSRQIGAFHEWCTAQLPCKINWNQSSVLEDIFTFGLNIETQTQRLPSLHTPTWTTPMYSWGISAHRSPTGDNRQRVSGIDVTNYILMISTAGSQWLINRQLEKLAVFTHAVTAAQPAIQHWFPRP